MAYPANQTEMRSSISAHAFLHINNSAEES